MGQQKSIAGQKGPRNTVTMACYGKGIEARQYEILLNSKITLDRMKESPYGLMPIHPHLHLLAGCVLLFYDQPYFPGCTTLVVYIRVGGGSEDSVCVELVRATMGKQVVQSQMPQNKELGFGLCLLFTFLLHFYFKRWKRE